MKYLVTVALLMAFESIGAQEAPAPPATWGDLLRLVQLERFQAELDLDSAAKMQIAKAKDALNDANAETRQATLVRLLNEQQRQRLKELRLQYLGAASLFDAQVRQDLGFNDAQARRVEENRMALQSQLDRQLSEIRFASADQQNDHIASFWRQQDTLLEILDKAQRNQFEKKKGKPAPKVVKEVE